VGAAPKGTDLIYFAFVNYTTLGYGDVTLVEAKRAIERNVGGSSGAMRVFTATSAHGRFCCRSDLKTLANGDSVL